MIVWDLRHIVFAQLDIISALLLRHRQRKNIASHTDSKGIYLQIVSCALISIRLDDASAYSLDKPLQLFFDDMTTAKEETQRVCSILKWRVAAH